MGHDIKGNRLDVKIIRNTDYVAGEGQDGFQGSRIRTLNRIEYPVAWNDLGDLDLVYKKYVLELFADIDDSGIAEVFFDNETAIKEIESYSDGVTVVDISNGKVYRFDFNATVGLQPDNNPDPEGRWVKVGELGGSSEVVTVQNAEVYDPTKIYEGGNVFVSFVNLSSPDPMFQTEALYRSSKTTTAGISPENDLQGSGNPTGKWVYQGQFAIIQDGGLAKIFYADEAEIQAITGYKDGNNAVNLTDGKIYEYDFFALSGIKPNDHTYPEGRWTEVGVMGGGGDKSYTIDFMTQNAYSPDINMYGDGSITAIATNNIDTIKLTYSGGVQVLINPALPNINILAGETLFWEITRTVEGQPAALGIKLELL